jgi:threonine/homoserine/homoserine lactone efflux protein
MTELLPPAHLLAAFLAASLVLAVTPGPGVFYIVARSITQGRRFGLASVAGVAAGNWCNAFGASIGLAALFAVSSAAFTAVKWAGAIYLILLGIQTIRGHDARADVERPPPTPVRKIVRDAFLVALLNPKTAVFFAAFLPQFMTAGANPTLQGALLGSMFVAIAAATDSLYAVTASSASVLLSRSRTVRRSGRFLAGGALVGLGVYTAVAGNRHST